LVTTWNRPGRTDNITWKTFSLIQCKLSEAGKIMMTKWLTLSVLILGMLTIFDFAASEEPSYLSPQGSDLVSNSTANHNSALAGDLADHSPGLHSLDDVNYSIKLRHILNDYINASFLLAAICHTDTDRVSQEDLNQLAEKNRLQWEDIERESVELMREAEERYGNGSETTLTIQSSSDSTPSSKNGESTTSLEYVMEHAPRDHVVRSLMEQFGFNARDAMSAITEINSVQAEGENNKANRAGCIERGLTILRDSCFAVVQFAGLVVAGPEITTVSGLARAYRATSFAVNGLDTVLAVGQLGTEISQADGGTAMITSARDNIGPLTLLTGWFDHRVLLRQEGLLKPFEEGSVWTNIYATFEDFKRRFTELNPRANTANQNAAPIADQRMAVPVINLGLTKPSGNVEIEWSPELYDRYIAPDSSEILAQNIPRVFPEGFYRIDGEEFEVGPSIADGGDESKASCDCNYTGVYDLAGISDDHGSIEIHKTSNGMSGAYSQLFPNAGEIAGVFQGNMAGKWTVGGTGCKMVFEGSYQNTVSSEYFASNYPDTGIIHLEVDDCTSAWFSLGDYGMGRWSRTERTDRPITQTNEGSYRIDGEEHEVGPSIADPISPDCREECPANAKCLAREEAKKKCDEEKKFCGEASKEPCGCNEGESKFCFSPGCPNCTAIDSDWTKNTEAFLTNRADAGIPPGKFS
jgi:hypothetical protein